mgnify:CR=1 FL=1
MATFNKLNGFVEQDPSLAGKSLEELQASITLDEYAHFGQRDAWMKENIQGVYESLTSNR